MVGYPVSYGYRGLVDGRWMIFSTEEEYLEYMKDVNDVLDELNGNPQNVGKSTNQQPNHFLRRNFNL